MSYYIQYRETVQLSEDLTHVVFKDSGKDNNVHYCSGETNYDLDIYLQERKRILVKETVEIAQFCESFARACDSGCIKCRGVRLSGPAAYKRKQSQLKKLGITIREPRLTQICWEGLPDYFFGVADKPWRRLKIKAGDHLSIDTVRALTHLQHNNHRFYVTVPTTSAFKLRISDKGSEKSPFLTVPRKST